MIEWCKFQGNGHWPSRTAPRVSKMQAKTKAWRNVSTLAPTEVPNEFATSFAPIPNAKINAMMNPTTIIHIWSCWKLTLSNISRWSTESLRQCTRFCLQQLQLAAEFYTIATTGTRTLFSMSCFHFHLGNIEKYATLMRYFQYLDSVSQQNQFTPDTNLCNNVSICNSTYYKISKSAVILTLMQQYNQPHHFILQF